MSDDLVKFATKEEKQVLKDLIKHYADSPNLYYTLIEEGHITRIDLDQGGDREPEVDARFLESFKNLKWLKILRIRDNDLWELPDWLGELTALQELMLNDNPIRRFPDSIGELTNLRELYKTHQRSLKWSNHRITELPKSFCKLKSLEILDLGDNRITSLPESFGELTSLRELYLNSNELTTLPESFGNLNSLQILAINHNKLDFLPESFGNLQLLEKLDVSSNKLTTLPTSFSKLTNLEKLETWGNNFDENAKEIIKLIDK